MWLLRVFVYTTSQGFLIGFSKGNVAGSGGLQVSGPEQNPDSFDDYPCLA